MKRFWQRYILWHSNLKVRKRCNKTDQLPIFFNCSTSWPSWKAYFLQWVQAEMRPNEQKWMWHVQEISVWDLHSTFHEHCLSHIWKSTWYYANKSKPMKFPCLRCKYCGKYLIIRTKWHNFNWVFEPTKVGSQNCGHTCKHGPCLGGQGAILTWHI